MTQPTLLNYVTCVFGKKGSWMAGYHTGVDYRAPVGTKIFATKGGTVVHSGTGSSYGSAYGSHVILKCRDSKGSVEVLYAHLSKPLVRKGQRVKTGQCIGLSGETGNTAGPHLHYEERVYPFNYWSHRRPIFPDWKPLNKRFLAAIRKRIGLKK